MVVTHSNSTQEEWQTNILYRFQKIKCSLKCIITSNVQIVAPHKQKMQYKTTDLFLKRL
jgi:hypothetical protein